MQPKAIPYSMDAYASQQQSLIIVDLADVWSRRGYRHSMAGKVSEERPHSVNDESLKRSAVKASERGIV